jgi:sugar porter (SP) family MFS transporter
MREEKKGYNRMLLLVAGLGGLLYGIDVGIIAGALPYMEATSGLNAGQLSFIVAAVLLGSVISTLFAGMLSDLLGRKPMMIASGVLFVASIPMIALAQGFGPLVMGRLLQGISAGLIGVTVPLYLAECLGASSRGKGTGIFQWLLTLGIVVAAVIGFYFSIKVEEVEKLHDAAKIFAFKDNAWRSIFWMSLPPGILFVLGSFMVSESPRWLFRRGKVEAARTALSRSRSPEQVELELVEMQKIASEEMSRTSTAGEVIRESLFQRRYVIPFLLACVILACNQATGINSIIGYNATILIQAGLSDKEAHLGYLFLTVVNFVMTIGAIMLVDRKGRKFLLSLGSAGIIVALLCVGSIFNKTEKLRVDCREAVQQRVNPVEQSAVIPYNETAASALLASAGEAGKAIAGLPTTLIVIYSYGDFRAATKVVRSTDLGAALTIDRGSCVPTSAVEAFFKNPFADLKAAKTAPLKIENALLTPIPSSGNGWFTAIFIFVFVAFFAVGPGVCVWLALSELMPTRIRSNGMSIALLINQAVSTTIAAVFLPTVGRFGYSTMFFAFAGFTVIYFITAFFFLPETKGRTLEEIGEHFERKR